MQLQVKYKDGTSRLVNLTDHFFSTKASDKQVDPGSAKKALDFAYMHGSDPYYIGVHRGNVTVFEQHIRKNQPDEQPIHPGIEVDETGIKKKLRREFKRKPFTDNVKLTF